MRRRQPCGVISKQEELVQSKSQTLLVCTECPDSITSLDPAYITLQSQLRDTSSRLVDR